MNRQYKPRSVLFIWYLISLFAAGSLKHTTTCAAVSFPRAKVPSRVSTQKEQVKSKQDVAVGSGTASIPNEVFNLVKSIVGAGVLGLPSGIAAFGDSPLALIPASILVLCIGMASSYGFSLIGRVCASTGATSYRDAWSESVSPKTSWIPALACLMVTSCTVLAYSIILSDTVPQLLSGVVDWGRTLTLCATTTVILLPLCLLKDLKSLAPFSILGIMGMIYTGIAMAVRYFGQNYAEGGNLWATIAPEFRPRFALAEAKQTLVETCGNSQLVVFICMLSTAYMAHYNAPKFYWELENNTLKRYQTVVLTSFGISVTMFATIASLGFLTFGQASDGLILNNYSTSDGIMSLSRFAVTTSILASYPLAFTGVRDGMLDMLKVSPAKRSDVMLNSLTVALLLAVTGLALVVTDLKQLLALAGATWGNAVIYLFPTYMYIQNSKNSEEPTNVALAVATGVMGLVMGIIGTTMALKGSKA